MFGQALERDVGEGSNECRVLKSKAANLESMKTRKTVMKYHPRGKNYIQQEKQNS